MFYSPPNGLIIRLRCTIFLQVDVRDGPGDLGGSRGSDSASRALAWHFCQAFASRAPSKSIQAVLGRGAKGTDGRPAHFPALWVLGKGSRPGYNLENLASRCQRNHFRQPFFVRACLARIHPARAMIAGGDGRAASSGEAITLVPGTVGTHGGHREVGTAADMDAASTAAWQEWWRWEEWWRWKQTAIEADIAAGWVAGYDEGSAVAWETQWEKGWHAGWHACRREMAQSQAHATQTPAGSAGQKRKAGDEPVSKARSVVEPEAELSLKSQLRRIVSKLLNRAVRVEDIVYTVRSHAGMHRSMVMLTSYGGDGGRSFLGSLATTIEEAEESAAEAAVEGLQHL